MKILPQVLLSWNVFQSPDRTVGRFYEEELQSEIPHTWIQLSADCFTILASLFSPFTYLETKWWRARCADDAETEDFIDWGEAALVALQASRALFYLIDGNRVEA